ncbi:MAG: hypothetical protein LBT26_01955 [Clostridiales Family XIII bacterium]|jgi:hypothetical protein|nr:hypothetical protein [Clostridiales Family XIII bacterium]
MEILYERCCGVDIHKKVAVACVIVKNRKEIRSFGTMTDDLLQLCAWLKESGVQMVAMESTGLPSLEQAIKPSIVWNQEELQRYNSN